MAGIRLRADDGGVMDKEDVMHDTLTPPGTERHRPSSARVVAAWTVAAVAMLITGLTALLAILAPSDSKPDLVWELAGLVAVIAIATWVAAVILSRVSGWALYVVAVVMMLLTAIGAYGGGRAEGMSILVASLVAIPVWVAAVLWNRTRARRRP
jgi:hypothetical protein